MILSLNLKEIVVKNNFDNNVLNTLKNKYKVNISIFDEENYNKIVELNEQGALTDDALKKIAKDRNVNKNEIYMKFI